MQIVFHRAGTKAVSSATANAGSTPLTTSSPTLDFRSQPKHGTTTTEIDDGTRHVLVAGLIFADGVAVGEAKDLGHVAGIDQIVYEYSARHRGELTPVSRRSLRL